MIHDIIKKKTFILIGIFLLMMPMVPMVNAIQSNTENNQLHTSQDLIYPSFQPGIYDKPPFTKINVNPDDNKAQVEFVYALIPQKILIDYGFLDNNELITFSLPLSDIHYEIIPAGIPAHVPIDYVSTYNNNPDEQVSVLWVPKHAIKIDKKIDSVTIECPKTMFLTFTNLDEMKDTIEQSKNENLQNFNISEKYLNLQVDINKSNLLRTGSFSERIWYSDYNTANHINGVTGIMQPVNNLNFGESLWSYHEFELYLQQPDYDTVEYIVYQRSDGRTIDFVMCYDDTTPSHPATVPLSMDVTDLSTYLEWYFYIEDGPVWYMHFRNPISGTWYTGSHIDTSHLSRYIKHITPSTELSLINVPPINYFYTYTTPFRADWVRTSGLFGNEWARPRDKTTVSDAPPNNQYVRLTYSWDAAGRIFTTQRCGSTVT